MKTFIKYPGGKVKELNTIKEKLPLVVKRYFEPFVGGGSVFLGLELKNSHINDISEDLILLFNLIKAKDPDFISKLNSLNMLWKELNENNWESTDFSTVFPEYNLAAVFNKYKEEEEKRKAAIIERHQRKCDDTFNVESVPVTIVKAAFYYTVRYVYNAERTRKTPNRITKALSYYFLREFCYAAMFRFSSLGEFNVPYGGVSYNNKSFDMKIDLINGYDLKDVKIYNEDYKRFLKRFKFNENDFIFVDPPYDSEFSDYDGNSFDKNSQIQLAEILSVLPAKIMVVIKSTDFIFNLYKEKGFYIKSFDKKYNVNMRNRNEREVKHLLITNYIVEED